MKKIFTLKTTLFIALFVMCGFVVKAQTDIILNGGFETWTEKHADNWGGSKTSAGNINFAKSTGARSGTNALELINTKPGHKRYNTTDYSLSKDVEYTFKYWVKGSGEIRNSYYSASNAVYGQYTEYTVLSNATWQQIEYKFIPEVDGDHQIILSFRSTSGSNLIVDDVQLIDPRSSNTPILVVSPESIEFPKTLEGNTSDVSTVSITAANFAAAPTYVISGTDAVMFSVEGILTTKGGDLSVTFKPTSKGNKSALLTVTGEGLSKTVELRGIATDVSNPYGLDDASPLTELSQDFENMTIHQPPTENWSSIAIQGDRNWAIKTYGGTKYAQMSAFGGTGKYQTLLISPAIDFDAIDKTKVSFSWKSGFANGATLKVYVMAKDGTKTEVKSITADAPTSGYAAEFTTETMDLTAHSGIKFLVFEYNGDVNVPNTTTYQIDNIVVSKSTGIHDISSQIKIFASDNQLYIDNDGSAKTIEVYNVLGRKLVDKVATPGLNVVPAQKGQLLIVKAGKKVAKVIVK